MLAKALLYRRVVTTESGIILPVSSTTRPIGEGEEEGVDYHYVGAEEFNRAFDDGILFERNEFGGNHYGAPHPVPILRALARPATILFELDVNGAQNLIDIFPQASWIGIVPPRDTDLLDRLNHRGRDLPEKIQKRYQQWLDHEKGILVELRGRHRPTAVIQNASIESSVQHLKALIGALPDLSDI